MDPTTAHGESPLETFRQGLVAMREARLGDARALLERVVEYDPRCALPRVQLSRVLMYQRRPDEAYRVAAEHFHDATGNSYALAYRDTNLGLIERARGNFTGAERWFWSATLRDGRCWPARLAHALTYLEAGDMRGFKMHEYRKLVPEWLEHNAVPDIPWWDGSPLDGRTLLVSKEGGLGDMLHMARFLAPLVAQAGGQVIAEAPEPIAPLIGRSLGVEMHQYGEPRPPVDVAAPWESLPHLLCVTRETIPTPPCLHPDPSRVASWRARLRLDPERLNVGLALLWRETCRPVLQGSRLCKSSLVRWRAAGWSGS